MQTSIEADGFEHLPITWQHSLRVGAYNHEHRDPFDRMLAAQSEIEAARLVTCDGAFGEFSTDVFWSLATTGMWRSTLPKLETASGAGLGSFEVKRL